MTGLTRSAVAYDLNISPHREEVPYEDGTTIVYVFSSDLYRKKFYARFLDNREQIGTSLSKRFGFKINNDLLADLKLYTTIEKRGFLIFKNEVKIECQENIILDGHNLTMQS